jgi:hypothetical protein
MNSVNNGSSGNPNRKTDFGDEGRLKYGPIKRKTKSSRPSFDQVSLGSLFCPKSKKNTQTLKTLFVQS